jgi:hypothetical protein
MTSGPLKTINRIKQKTIQQLKEYISRRRYLPVPTQVMLLEAMGMNQHVDLVNTNL